MVRLKGGKAKHYQRLIINFNSNMVRLKDVACTT